RVMLYMYLIPVAGVGLAAAFFGDPLTPARVVGGLIVLAGVVLTRVGLDRAAPPRLKKPRKNTGTNIPPTVVAHQPATPGTGGRRAFVSRQTKETRIAAAINLDGTGQYDIKTGIGFLDHMLEQLSRHSLIDITLRAEGDLHIDYH